MAKSALASAEPAMKSSRSISEPGESLCSEALKWPVPQPFNDAPEVVYRNSMARALLEKDVSEIVASYVYLSPQEMRLLLLQALRRLNQPPLRGVGIELGAGCGLLASIVAEYEGVAKSFALEVCEELALSVIPKVSKCLLGSKAQKVVPVVGVFDDLKLADESLDFVVEIDSLHHSHNLGRTMCECARVLKRSGRILCFDRCHANALTDAQIELMLCRTYSRDFLVRHHYPPDIVLTRRDNGEHEYRLFKWQKAFDEAGLKLMKTVEMHKHIEIRAAIKGLLAGLPKAWRRKLYKSDGQNSGLFFEWLLQRLGRIAESLGIADSPYSPKHTTVFLLTKL